MFRGRSRHTLDAKGRLAIPARFKEVLDHGGDDFLVVTNKDSCLWAFTRADWRVLEEKTAKISLFHAAGTAFLRYFISGAVECQIKQGRITIPLELRVTAGLKKEVMLVGVLKRFEIWDQDKWDEEYKRVSESFPDVSESLPDLGI
jgi:MraZ protein